MANNRVELATLPRYIDTVPGKTTGSGLILNTDVISFVFQPTTGMTGMDNANLAITATGVYTVRLEEFTLALIFEDDNDTDGFPDGAWYSYRYGNTRSDDAWTLLGAASVTITTTDDTISEGTVVRRYQFTADGVDIGTIPIATWAQDASTTNLIPRQKLPDISYGDQYFYTSITARDANLIGYLDRGMTMEIPVPTGGNAATTPRVTWHQNDVAVILGATSADDAAFLYVGTDQTVANATVVADWLQFGSIVQIAKVNQFLTVIDRTAVTIPVSPADNIAYQIGTDGTIITFTDTNFALDEVIEVSINGVTLTELADYTINTARNMITFIQFVFPATGTDLVHISGVKI